jgi:hypothetical protein
MPRGSLALFIALSLAACQTPYSPGALLSGPAAPLASSLGCLELMARPEKVFPPSGVLLAFEMGNRCYHPTCFDLGQVGAVAHGTFGERVELQAFDPRQELRRACLDGHSLVTERILFVAQQPVDWVASVVCLNYSRIEPRSPRTVRCFRFDETVYRPAGEP